ncbi:MAG: hypothetical protein JO097_18735 [Acidobacteriaceae bacterium]|nr:hypothetical protein [Acidobacteriaceae bacterium]MBV9296144.1 hypothetical protein [Acidobacteriaceae bacterium]MBV9766323.1 hypothetical protein [Acidobacteriaceae bacterium]
MPKPSDLLQGTLDLLIRKTIAPDPLQGWTIAKRIQVLSGDVLTREGRKQLEHELSSWNRLSSAVQLLIETA